MDDLWQHYVFRTGAAVHDLWDSLFDGRHSRLLYIAGRGFDLRAQAILDSFVANAHDSKRTFEVADLMLIKFAGYQLSEELVQETERNAGEMTRAFKTLSSDARVSEIVFGSPSSEEDNEDEVSPSNALRLGTSQVLAKVDTYTDIILDASSLPRVVYLSLLTALLDRLVPDKAKDNALAANGVNLQVLVAEDSKLDAAIRAEDPSNDLILIPGFSGVLHVESVQDWPLVWFPMLGEGRVNQLLKVGTVIPDTAEICPVLPHPALDPRRADRLLMEYRQEIFVARQTPTSNILYAHEAHPFEAYRQLLHAMRRYRTSLLVLGGCRLVVTPLASKLITIGAGLACFEMKPSGMDQNYGVAIPYAEPKRYSASVKELRSSKAQIAALLLTGSAYETGA